MRQLFDKYLWDTVIGQLRHTSDADNLEAHMASALRLSKSDHTVVQFQEDFVKALSSGDANEFTVWMPGACDIVKSDKDDKWRMGGICSTERKDRQGEVLVQKGLDFGEFVQHGYYNDNHQQHTAAVVGIPELAELRPGGWYTQGYLLKQVKRAQEIYTLAKALNGTGRKLGFSVEGKVVLRDPMQQNKVLKAVVRNVAVTNSPVNTDATWDIVMKAWANMETDSAVKALSAGNAVNASVSGDVIRPDSTEDRMRDLGFAVADVDSDGKMVKLFRCQVCKKALFTDKEAVAEHIKKSHDGVEQFIAAGQRGLLDLNQTVEYIQRMRPNFSKSTCERIAQHIFKGGK